MRPLLACVLIFVAWISIQWLPNCEVFAQEGPTVQNVSEANNSATRSVPDAKELRKIIAFSESGHWALLGGRWLVDDGQLKSLAFPQPLLYPSPVAFFDRRTVLLYVHRADSTGAIALLDIQSGKSKDICLSSEEPHAPAASPDKRHVAFVTAKGRLQVVDLETQQMVDLAPAWKSTPSWSIDGNSIVFEKNRDHDQGWGFSEVATVSLPSGKISVLDKGRFPSWCPRGDLIAYTDVDGKHLSVTAPDGTHRRTLKTNMAAVRGPLVGPLVWSPDGEKLIFHRIHDSWNGDEHSEAYVLDTKTGHVERLLNDEVVLAWR